MFWRGPTRRVVAGETVPGVWCHVWVTRRSATRPHVDDLFVFADGLIGCDGTGLDGTDVEGLRRRLADGRVLLHDPERSAPATEPERPRWSARYPEPLTADGFVAEVLDRIAELNDRPTTADRCHDAIRRWRREPTEANRRLVRNAYLAVPAHERVFLLGDMDLQDIPLRRLATDPGQPVCGDGPIATEEMYLQVKEYFDAGDRGEETYRAKIALRHADDPAPTPAVILNERGGPSGDVLDDAVLRNEFPSPLTYRGQTYRTALHAYWAQAVAAPDDHDRVRDAETAHEAQELGGSRPLQPDWPARRLAVMTDILRAKFAQHPPMAAILLATGDAPLSYQGYSESPFWTDRGPRGGRNWMGRLLELVRSELNRPAEPAARP
ncbi:NADAR family protein [Actinomadura logoneensis]|uniref:NADAR family protein n=1 Tax=Actinomadura logoneensis TaxID=2293572 RepID=A0A372JAI6_9ACTN|nr:NADAR family protein [Actinomadura logoneensis]RFU36992.1 NADAR family protein [Actinomadura logoneensis]